MTLALPALLLATAAALSACASLPPPAVGEAPPRTGRLLVRVEARDGAPAQQHSGAFELRGSAEQGQLRLLSPLGTQVALARWSPAGAELVDASGTRRFDDLDALAFEALGEAVPLGALPDWLAARPWPGAPSVNGPGDGFTQLGWTVDLSRFAADALIEARRAAPPAVLLRAKLDSAV
ncbi:MAG: outer membrane lipoprotein LolB [Vitreoscilla sp.]|nr:outer membrane lipoprotein LolB [Vitreoscilla sp.]